jgi:WD40 repeat protein
MGNFAGSRKADTRPVPQEPLLEPLKPLICCPKKVYWTPALAILPTPDGAAPRIVTAPYEVNHPIDVWDSDTGTLTHSFTDHAGCVRALVSYELEPGHGHNRLASAHGRVGGGMLMLWAVDEDFRQVASVAAHQGGVTSLLLLEKGVPEGEGRPLLVSSGCDASVKVWNTSRTHAARSGGGLVAISTPLPTAVTRPFPFPPWRPHGIV